MQTLQQERVEPGRVRRPWLTILVTAVVLAALVLGAWAIIEATQGDELELPDVLDRWAQAVEAGDAEAIAALHTEDGVWYDRAIPRTLQGRSSIESGLREGLRYLTLTETELLRVERTGDTVVTEWSWAGTSSTHARAAGDQTPFTAEVEFVFELEGDLIACSTDSGCLRLCGRSVLEC